MQVAEADEGTSVDGMKAACTMLAEPAGGRVATSTVALFVADADRLVVLLTAKSRQVFASSLAQVRERWIASRPFCIFTVLVKHGPSPLASFESM